MKYIIIGSGPTGLSLAYILALNNKNVILIEQDDQLGGSWNSQWIDNKYWSENSPRVCIFNKNTEKIMKHIGLKKNDFKNIYGNVLETQYKIMLFLFKYFKFLDYLIFLFAIIKYNLVTENITLMTWIKQNKLSKTAINAITILSITICDKPENTNINDFFCSFGLNIIKQMTEPNKWHNIIEEYLKTKKNVTILKNTKVIKLIDSKKSNIINSVYIQNLLNNSYSEINGDKIFLCTQSNNIYPILKLSSYNVKNNWMSETKMKIWSENTFYIGFGFQLHFDKKIDFKNEWCWSCKGDWTVIILPVSNWLKTFSKDSKVKTVWSCCIVDMDTKSKKINKTANECNLNEVINECIYQINKFYTIPNPYKITTSKGLKKHNNKWMSNNTGYTKNTYDDLSMKGKIDNLFALGCFTKEIKTYVAYMGGAFDSVVNYIKIYEKNMKIKVF